MNIEDLPKVSKLMDVTRKLNLALEAAKSNLTYISGGNHAVVESLGSIKGSDCSIRLSFQRVELMECYVGEEIATAIIQVIEDKKQTIVDSLVELGVQFPHNEPTDETDEEF